MLSWSCGNISPRYSLALMWEAVTYANPGVNLGESLSGHRNDP